MRQRLLLVGIACALVVGGWAGVLAAVVCPHAGGATTAGEAPHDCCRGLGDGDGAGCPIKFGRPDDGHHREKADASHGASHESREEPRVAVVESASGAGLVGALERRTDFCAHCVGNRLPPPSSTRLSAPEAAKRDELCAAPRAENPPAPSRVAYEREVIPTQGAPPGPARLYVLNSAFLI